MFHPNSKPSFFDWLRRNTALRVLLLLAASMMAQSGVACACDGASPTPETAQVADLDSPDEGGPCCSQCTDCAQCGGCHASAMSPRAEFGSLRVVNLDARMISADAARAPWTPPTHYRPPIGAA